MIDSGVVSLFNQLGGVVTAGVGLTKPTYSIFGDAVNVAEHMEQTSQELRIQISENSYHALSEIGGYETVERSLGEDDRLQTKTYWLIGKTDRAIQPKLACSANGDIGSLLPRSRSTLVLNQVDSIVKLEGQS